MRCRSFASMAQKPRSVAEEWLFRDHALPAMGDLCAFSFSLSPSPSPSP
jgi:hypothetical protein